MLTWVLTLAQSDGGLAGEDANRATLKAVLFWGAIALLFFGLLGAVIRSAIKSSAKDRRR